MCQEGVNFIVELLIKVPTHANGRRGVFIIYKVLLHTTDLFFNGFRNFNLADNYIILKLSNKNSQCNSFNDKTVYYINSLKFIEQNEQ